MNINNILIANRGLPAIKFINSIREWCLFNEKKMTLICLATPDDLNSNYKYLDYADKVIYTSNNKIYNSIEEIIKICLSNSIQSVWPGWGYLSEESEFSKALKENNIIFIGPSEYSLKLLGDKVECMKLADRINIPQLKWSGDCSNDINFLREHSLKIGLPVILKSSNGGGGKGIRILENIEDIDDVVYQIKSEATGKIFVMKLANQCKHLEVQIVSDGDMVITLGTRDCSIQRRRQKLIEEAPASFPSNTIIQLMLDSAKKIVKEVGLKGVCTVEFLLEGDSNLSFMEVNPRLQVEHIVTETIFNLNLPSIQVLLAEGTKIKDIKELINPVMRGHAISCRINSENGFEGFKPLTGKIKSINYNSSSNTWAYFSVNNNSLIGDAVDNQFGHVVAWGETREIARKRMYLFLQNLIINSEVINTASFLKELILEDKFIQEKHNVTWLDNKKFISTIDNELIIVANLIVKAYNSFLIDNSEKNRLIKNGHTEIERYFNDYYHIELVINELIYKCKISFNNYPYVEIENGNNIYRLEFKVFGKFFYLFSNNNKLFSININHIDDFGIKTNISRFSYNLSSPVNPNEFRAAVGGKITKINFKENQFVKKGDTILIIEIMKMAVNINTNLDGKIKINVNEGDKIEKNQLLFLIENKDTKLNKKEIGIFKKLDEYIIKKDCNKNTIAKVNKSLSKQELCFKLKTTYIYDMIEYFDYQSIEELYLDVNQKLVKKAYDKYSNKKYTILAFEIILKNGIKFILIANDITIKAGSFSWDDDIIFLKSSEYARYNKIPRIYISSNSGARLELNQKIKDKFKIKWKDDNIEKGFDFIYIDDNELEGLNDEICIEKIQRDDKLFNKIIKINNQGVKNLNGSAMIASETSKAFEEIFTLTYVTGRSVGIGAYLTKLGIRTIQKRDASIILTGNMALNKVLGMNLYKNNLEIGGPDIMSVNSTSHIIVDEDREGINKIQEWLSYVYLNPLNFKFLKSNAEKYLLKDVNNVQDYLNYFFGDERLELFNSWGGSLLIGKARLNKYPLSYIVCNDLLSQTKIPVDPGDIHSVEVIKNNPGSILNSDASQKLSQFIKESNIEGLPTLFLVNLRGFSGGTKDLLDQVLTFGSDIVRNLCNYKRPFYIYLLPNSQLRGGAMVVISKLINKDNIEIYADSTASCNILEPDGLKEIKFRKKDIIERMKIDNIDTSDLELYQQYDKVALHFCELHDKINNDKDFDGIIDISMAKDFFSNKIEKYYKNI